MTDLLDALGAAKEGSRVYPIIFSGPMVRALLDGRKTMTRRLAWRTIPDPADPEHLTIDVASHWRRVKPGDRLWMRENIYQFGGKIEYPADGPPSFKRKMTPSILMPRWASRLTLGVTATKVERLQDISEADAKAEGIEPDTTAFWQAGWKNYEKPGWVSICPIHSFASLWRSLHGDKAWDANPEVIAISFTTLRARAAHDTNMPS